MNTNQCMRTNSILCAFWAMNTAYNTKHVDITFQLTHPACLVHCTWCTQINKYCVAASYVHVWHRIDSCTINSVENTKQEDWLQSDDSFASAQNGVLLISAAGRRVAANARTQCGCISVQKQCLPASKACSSFAGTQDTVFASRASWVAQTGSHYL